MYWLNQLHGDEVGAGAARPGWRCDLPQEPSEWASHHHRTGEPVRPNALML